MEIQLYITHINLFIYQARGVLLGPSRVSDSPVSAENMICDYVSARNWAVRNPAGIRLDSSSLVNKLVVTTCGWLLLGMRVNVYFKGNFLCENPDSHFWL